MRYSVLVCFILGFWGCELDYEDNERLLIKGNVNNGTDSAFPNLPIEVFAYDGGGFLSSGIKRIGIGEVQPDGSFDIVALSPRNAASLELTVNKPSHKGYAAGYSSLIVRGFDFLDLEDATYVIPEGSIDKLTNAVVEILRVENMTDSLRYSLRYQTPVQTLDYTQLENIADYSNQQFVSGFALPEEKEVTIRLSDVKAKDTLLFEYTLVKVDTLETGETRFALNPQTNNYVFEF